MTPDLLQAAIGCTPALAAAWCADLDEAMHRYAIDTPARQAAFLAQIAHESGGLARLVENLNYSAEGLCKVWPNRFRSYGDAVAYARKPEAIANYVYADRMGNGPANTGEGWKYRGRGLIQATGKNTYRSLSAALEVDLLGNPDRLQEPHLAAMSAGWYWSTHGLNERADQGDFEGITRKINGGLTGLADRTALWKRARQALGAA